MRNHRTAAEDAALVLDLERQLAQAQAEGRKQHFMLGAAWQLYDITMSHWEAEIQVLEAVEKANTPHLDGCPSTVPYCTLPAEIDAILSTGGKGD